METKTVVCWTPNDPTLATELTRSLTDDERRRIEQRIAVLDKALALRDPVTIIHSVTGLMLGMQSSRVNEDDSEILISAYVNALADLPPWAANEAANRFARGKVHGSNPAFAPSTAEMRAQAEAITATVAYEREQWRRMLVGTVVERREPKPMTPAIKAAIKAEAHKVVAEQKLAERAEAPLTDFQKLTASPALLVSRLMKQVMKPVTS